MVLDQQIECGRTGLVRKPSEVGTGVSGSVGPLLTPGLLSLAWPGKEGSALSAACSVLPGPFMSVLCFIMPTVTLFTLSLVSSGSFMVVSIVGSDERGVSVHYDEVILFLSLLILYFTEVTAEPVHQ